MVLRRRIRLGDYGDVMIIIGIDPGLDGAVAVLYPDDDVRSSPELFDTPTFLVTGGRKDKREHDEASMANILRAFKKRGTIAVLERVHAMPGQGVTSMFSMGNGYGLWRGLLTGLRIPYELITPQSWKKLLMKGQGQGKDASRQVAMRLFPQAADRLKLKKHHGRADALLMAEYKRRLG